MPCKSQSRFVRRSKPTGPYCFKDKRSDSAKAIKSPCNIYNGRRVNRPTTIRPLTTESVYSLTNPPPSCERKRKTRAAK